MLSWNHTRYGQNDSSKGDELETMGCGREEKHDSDQEMPAAQALPNARKENAIASAKHQQSSAQEAKNSTMRDLLQ